MESATGFPRISDGEMGDPDRAKSVIRPRVLVVNDDVLLADTVPALLTDESYDARCTVESQAARDPLARWPQM